VVLDSLVDRVCRVIPAGQSPPFVPNNKNLYSERPGEFFLSGAGPAGISAGRAAIDADGSGLRREAAKRQIDYNVEQHQQ
jgi:hypothetical protein